MVGTQHLLLFLRELRLQIALMHTVEHESRDILRAQLLRQILSPLLRGQPPVLIAVESAIAVHILEGFAIDRQQFHTRICLQPQLSAAFILHQQIAIRRFCLRIVLSCRSLYLRTSHRQR